MKVTGLDNKEYKLKLVNKATEYNDLRKKSENHKIARELLIDVFPYDQLHEEVVIQGCPSLMYLDFFIPQRRIAIEVNGAQHKKYVPYFHGSIENFLKQKKRDLDKKKWCEINNITLVELDDNERDKWREKILDRPA